jgi:hypothetical protein
MKKIFNFSIYIILLMSYNLTYSQLVLPPNNPLYDSVFIENFSSIQLDSSKWIPKMPWGQRWTYDTLYCGSTIYNTQGYDDYAADTTNRTIGGGTCKLIARKENNTHSILSFTYDCTSAACTGYPCYNPQNGPPNNASCMIPYNVTYKYSSGALTSKKSFKYGYFEMRFRFPGWYQSTYYRITPAYWMFNGNSTAEWSEIDIFEIKGDSGHVTNSIHMDATVNNNVNGHWIDPYPSNPLAAGGFSINLSQWHTMSLWWQPDSVSFFCDGNFLRSSKQDTNQYLIDMPVIIENQINSYFRSCVYRGIDSINSPLPITMEIDYVKTWQPKLACDTDKVYCNITQATFNSKIYKSLTIGGSGCSATFNNSRATAEGNNYVLLQEGFEAGNNMEMIFRTEACWTDMKINNTTISPSPYLDPNISKYIMRHF